MSVLAPNLSAADFTAAIQALLPSGRAWPREPDATIAAFVAGLGAVYAAQTANANALLIDAFPSTVVHLLPEWQASLGLPDSAGIDPRAAAAQVVWKFASFDGPTPAAFIAYAEAMGFTVTVKSHATFRAGQSKAGQPCGANKDWFATFEITGPASLAPAAGLLAEVKPAHTILWVRLYTSVWDGGGSVWDGDATEWDTTVTVYQ